MDGRRLQQDNRDWMWETGHESVLRKLELAPDLPMHLIHVWNAFWALSADRPIGMAVGAIRFEAIDRYAERFRITDFAHFHAMLRHMDAIWLENANKKKKD